MTTYTTYQKAFYADTKNCSVLLKAEFHTNGTNSLRAGRCVLFPLLPCTRKGKKWNRTFPHHVECTNLAWSDYNYAYCYGERNTFQRGSSMWPVKSSFVVDVECTRYTQPGGKIKDIKTIRPRPRVSKPVRADAFFGSLKKSSFLWN